MIEAQLVASDHAPIDWTDDSVEPTSLSGGADSATGPKVASPEGKSVGLEAAEVASAASPGSASERTGSVLKAERVML